MPLFAAPVIDPETGRLVDVRMEADGKSRHLCGRDGEKSLEEAVREAVSTGRTPLFVGFGLGRAPLAALHLGVPRVVAIDRETAILQATLPASGLADDPRLVVISDPDPDTAARMALDSLSGIPCDRVTVLQHPGVVRLDRPYYAQVVRRLGARRLFYQQAHYRKFRDPTPRVLLVHSNYFLVEEIRSALSAMDIPTRFLALPERTRGQTAFIEELLAAVTGFRPDFLLTVNHLGLDREGRLMALLAELQLPLASWFVDNPHLILHDYPNQTSPWCTVFTWDQDTVASLEAMGFHHPTFLPLATDPQRFRPPHPGEPVRPSWAADVSFVGHSMVRQVGEPLDRLRDFPELTRDYAALAARFARSGYRSVSRFLAETLPEVHAAWQTLPDVRTRLDFELLVTWEATRAYRARCVEALLPFSPLLVGDRHWKKTLPASPAWRWHPPLDYYRELPRFYPCSHINLNCTSLQMKGAVNQRVFDVPACGGFVLTDRREQLHLAFAPQETACYDDPDEIPDLVRHYLAHPQERRRISAQARNHILAEHTYVHRLGTLLSVLRATYS
ncbi:MAG: glycosyltransferase [Desulfovibrionaceae bacterium]|nr:glycosyltransferase [Desulfovibrionaceae bacterium]